jgi:hypothetical protein
MLQCAIHLAINNTLAPRQVNPPNAGRSLQCREQIERKSSRLESSSALNQVKNQDDDGNYEQEMNQAAANVADETKKPENDQNDNYSPEHA